MKSQGWLAGILVLALVAVGVAVALRPSPDARRVDRPATTRTVSESRREGTPERRAEPRETAKTEAPRPMPDRILDALRRGDRAALRSLLDEALALITPRKIPDDQNAAPLYREAFGKIAGLTEEIDDARDAVLAGTATPEQRELLRKYLEQNADGLRLLREAAARPGCNFELDLSKGFDLELPHITGLIRASKLLGLAADVMEGDRTATLEAHRRLTEAVSGEPLVISQLVRAVTVGIHYSTSGTAIGDASSKEELRKFLGSLDPASVREAGCRSVLGEMVIALRAMEVPSKMYPIFPFGWNDERGRLDAICYAEVMTEYHALLARPYLETREEIERLEQRADSLPYYAQSTRELLPALSRMHENLARSEAGVEALRLATSVRLFRLARGYYPTSLEEMRAAGVSVPTNPLTGGGFGYRLDGSGFVISGVGGVELKVPR